MNRLIRATPGSLARFLSTFNRTEVEDPLKTCLFRIEMDGFQRLGFQEMSAPKAVVEKAEYREGGQNLYVRKSPGLLKVDDIDLKRGLIIDGPASDFDTWFKQVVDMASGKGAKVFRKNVDVLLLNRQLIEVRRIRLYECWPSGYQPYDNLNGTEAAKDQVESLTLTFERFDTVLF